MSIKCRPWVLGIFPHPWIKYYIEGDKAYIEEGFWIFKNQSKPVYLLGSATADQKRRFNLLNVFRRQFGDITISDDKKSITWKQVYYRLDKANYINNFKQHYHAQKEEDKESSRQNPRDSKSAEKIKYKEIPDDVELSKKVLLLPKLPFFLNGIIRNYLCSSGPIYRIRDLQYTWVDKGDPIYHIEINDKPPKRLENSKYVGFTVKSPVSGFVIYTGGNDGFYDSEDGDINKGFNDNWWLSHFCILLSESSKADITDWELYEELYNYCLNTLPITKECIKNELVRKEFMEAGIDVSADPDQTEFQFRAKIKSLNNKPIEMSLQSDEFIKNWDEIINTHPNPKTRSRFEDLDIAKARIELAYSSFDKRYYHNARKYFEQAAPKYSDPEKHAETIFRFGMSREASAKKNVELIELKKAREEYRKALEINPDHPYAKSSVQRINRAFENRWSFDDLLDSDVASTYEHYSGITLPEAQKLSNILKHWKPLSYAYDQARLDKQYAKLKGELSDESAIRELDEQYNILKDFLLTQTQAQSEEQKPEKKRCER